MSRNRAVFEALPIVAAHYGQRFGVKVCVGSEEAGTDGQVICVPNVPETYPHKNVIWGLLVHEAGHIRDTCFVTWNSVHTDREPLRKFLFNCFEDFRIELNMMRRFPGVSRDIESAITYLKDTGGWVKATEQCPPVAVLQASVLYWGRTFLLKQSLGEYSSAADQALEKLFPAGVVVRLDTIRRKGASTTSTAECLQLADAIICMLKEEEEKEREKHNKLTSGCSDDSSDSADGGSDGSSASDDLDDSSTAVDRATNGGSDLGDDDSKEKCSRLNDIAAPMSVPPSSSQGVADRQGAAELQGKLEAIQNALNAGSNDSLPDMLEQLRQELFTEAHNGDSTYRSVPYAPRLAGNVVAGQDLLSKVQSTSSKLSAQLLGLVQSYRLNRDKAAAAGRRIDGKRLPRLLAGDTRIFKQRIDRKEPNTAVHILADLSGSMRGVPEVIAREASLSIALALEAIPRVSPAVTYFSGSSDDPVRSAVRHGESVKKNAHRFIDFTRGSTPLAEGLWYAAFELSKLAEHRRMIVVITDGDPDSRGACDTVLKLCRNAGIETIGIGIRHEKIKQLFDSSIVINDVSELRTTLFQLMRDQLTFAAA